MEEEEKENSSEVTPAGTNNEGRTEVKLGSPRSRLESGLAENCSSSEEDDSSEEDAAPSSLTVTPELLADILHEKQMLLLQSPEVVQFLRDHQAALVRNTPRPQATCEQEQNHLHSTGKESASSSLTASSDSGQRSLPNR